MSRHLLFLKSSMVLSYFNHHVAKRGVNVIGNSAACFIPTNDNLARKLKTLPLFGSSPSPIKLS